MAVYTQPQIAALWNTYAVVGSSAVIASAIAMAESGGTSTVINNDPATEDYSVGLWQINYFGTLRGPRTALYGPPTQLVQHVITQVYAATQISGGGTTWNAWTTYRNGAYLQFLPGGSGELPTAPTPLPTTTAWKSYTYQVLAALTTWVLLQAKETEATMAEAIGIFQSI